MRVISSEFLYNGEAGITTAGKKQYFDSLKIIGNGSYGLKCISRTTSNQRYYFAPSMYSSIIDSNLIGIISDSIRVYNSSISNNDSMGVISKGEIILEECTRINNDTIGVVIERNADKILPNKISKNIHEIAVTSIKDGIMVNLLKPARLHYSIYNIQGKLIYSHRINKVGTRHRLLLKNRISAGAYILKLTAGKQNLNLKFTVR